MSNELEQHQPTMDADLAMILGGSQSPVMQIMLNDRLFERAKLIAKYMSNAQGFTPRHLIGQTEACLAVVMRSLTWKLDPYAVACSTYQTPGGTVGFEGKLVQAILENSGKLEGPVGYEYYGDWSQVQGKFDIKNNDKGKKYPWPAWKDEDEEGLGVIVSAKVVGEVDRRTLSFDLRQAFPRNSTLWATDPRTQLGYTAVRRFANVAAPGLFMGVPFDREDMHYGAENAKDITPRPTRGDYLDAEDQRIAEAAAARRQAKADEAALDAGYAGATGGHDTAEDPDHAEAEPDPEAEAEQQADGSQAASVADEAQPAAQDAPSTGTAGAGGDSGEHPYLKSFREQLALCRTSENLEAFYAGQADNRKQLPADVLRAVQNMMAVRRKEVGGGKQGGLSV